jgi:lauroyl/myristoyl acyltransferase
MTIAQAPDCSLPTRRADHDRRIVVSHRSPSKPVRSLIKRADVSAALTIIFGVLAIMAPPSGWKPISRICARWLDRSRRSRVAIAALRDVAGLDADQARLVINELNRRRVFAHLWVLRGLCLRRYVHVDVEGARHLQDALAGGHGAVVWVADFVQAGDVSKIGLKNLGWPASHVSRPEHGYSSSRLGIALLNPVRTRYENRFLHERILHDRDHPGETLRRLTERLGQNGVVTIMASAHEGRSVADVDFLDGRLQLAIGALRLAHRARCPILPAFTLMQSSDAAAHALILEAPLCTENASEDEFVRAGLRDFVTRLERHVQSQPGSWVGWRRTTLRARPPGSDTAADHAAGGSGSG